MKSQRMRVISSKAVIYSNIALSGRNFDFVKPVLQGDFQQKSQNFTGHISGIYIYIYITYILLNTITFQMGLEECSIDINQKSIGEISVLEFA